jgi:hypothetical protein
MPPAMNLHSLTFTQAAAAIFTMLTLKEAAIASPILGPFDIDPGVSFSITALQARLQTR